MSLRLSRRTDHFEKSAMDSQLGWPDIFGPAVSTMTGILRTADIILARPRAEQNEDHGNRTRLNSRRTQLMPFLEMEMVLAPRPRCKRILDWRLLSFFAIRFVFHPVPSRLAKGFDLFPFPFWTLCKEWIHRISSGLLFDGMTRVRISHPVSFSMPETSSFQ
jgi:hypothetical protein